MRSTKCQTILLLYEVLVRRGYFRKEDVLGENQISDPTFKRYVSEIRCFLANFHPEEELVYDKKEDVYRLRHQ
jgi:hypothetical protein